MPCITLLQTFSAHAIMESEVVNTGNALHLLIKLHAGRVRTGGGFQVFRSAKLKEHSPRNSALLCPDSMTQLVDGSIRIALQADAIR